MFIYFMISVYFPLSCVAVKTDEKVGYFKSISKYHFLAHKR